MSKYDREVKQFFKLTPNPCPGFIVDMIEYPNTLALRFYKPNVEDFSQGQKVLIAEYLYTLRNGIRDLGVKCELDGVESAPPNAK